MKSPFLILIRTVLLGAATITSAAGEDLSAADFFGLRLALVHDTRIEIYRLSSNGTALALSGTRSGPVAAPTYRWKIEAGHLVIMDAQGVKERFEIIARSDEQLATRRRSGEVAVFRISRME